MRRFLRSFVLLSCFTVHVHVRAAEAIARAAHSAEDFTFGESKMRLAQGALVEKRKENAAHLVKGEALAYLKGKDVLQTAYAYVRCQSDDCKALVHREKDRVTFGALEGVLLVHRLGENKDYVLPTAMQVSVGGVMADGYAEMDFPQSLPWDETVKSWARLFRGDLKEFKSTLAEFREVWHESVEAVSHLHEERAQRVIASHDKAVQDQQARQKAQEREDEELRKLFREKSGFSQ